MLREAARISEETARMQAEIEEIDHGARLVQPTKCAACHQPLDLPTVHFLCLHSFHPACLGDSDHECIVCAPQRRRLRAITEHTGALTPPFAEALKSMWG